MVDHSTRWSNWLVPALAMICLSSILMNYRGRGTLRAIFIILVGIFLIALGLYTPGAMVCYYAGSALLLLGSLYNGRGYQWLSAIR
jgi:membrane-bound ClpP family serine protease